VGHDVSSGKFFMHGTYSTKGLMIMRDTRWIVMAAGVLATSALFTWIWLTLFPLGFHHAADAAEQAGAQGEPVEGSAEPNVYGVVKLVDLGHRRATLSIGTKDGKEQEQTYDLAKDAEVLLDGLATLDELAAGTRVGLVFGPDGNEVVAIRSEPFQITVEPKQHEVEVGKPFDVVLRVTNVSPAPQSFWVMLTTWDGAWISNNPRITWLPFNSWKNFPIPLRLSPGEVYEKTLAIKAIGSGQLSFKMGFMPGIVSDKPTIDGRPNPLPFRGDNKFFLPSERTYWSSEVTVEVK
jgi:hypothetical protein